MEPSADLFFRPPRNIDDADAMIAAVCRLLDARRLSLRAPPPIPTSCCGRGCNGCVWQGYFEALLNWRDDAAALLDGDRLRAGEQVGHQDRYTAVHKNEFDD